MGKYCALRKLNCLRKIKTALVAAHCPIVAQINLAPFEVAHRIAIVSGMAALPTVRCDVATILGPDTS
jgi:hypothetical protein